LTFENVNVIVEIARQFEIFHVIETWLNRKQFNSNLYDMLSPK